MKKYLFLNYCSSPVLSLRAFFVSWLLAFQFSACSHHLVKKESLIVLNEYYSDKTYYLKDNIQIGNNETIQKGASVKIWIESTPSLLKVKCYPSTEEREYAIGKLIIYIVNEDYKSKSMTREELDKIIAEKLVLYNPKNKRHR